VTRKIEKKKKDLAASQSPMMGPSNDELIYEMKAQIKPTKLFGRSWWAKKMH
jgi:hypothetical protein